MVEISTSILNVKKGKESETFFKLERAKTDKSDRSHVVL